MPTSIASARARARTRLYLGFRSVTDLYRSSRHRLLSLLCRLAIFRSSRTFLPSIVISSILQFGSLVRRASLQLKQREMKEGQAHRNLASRQRRPGKNYLELPGGVPAAALTRISYWSIFTKQLQRNYRESLPLSFPLCRMGHGRRIKL